MVKNRNEIPIIIYPSHIEIEIPPNGIIHNVNVGLFIKKYLTNYQWNHWIKKYQPTMKFSLYNFKTKRAHIPYYTLESFLKFLTDYNIKYTLIQGDNVVTSKEININVKKEYKDKSQLQTSLINYLIDKDNNPTMKLVAAQTGVGKPLRLSAKIRTPDSWMYMGDMSPGETIITPDGSYASVTAVYPQGEQDLYRITFEDDRYIDCGKDHQWKVFSNLDPIWKIYTTEKMINFLQNKNHKLYIPLIDIEPYSNDINLPLDPYELGTILETYNTIETNDKYNSYISILNDLNLLKLSDDEKFIPHVYLNAPYHQKILLLKGIFDINGQLRKSNDIIYQTTSKQMTNDLIYLIRSLGGICKVKISNETNNKIIYILKIKFKHPELLFTSYENIKSNNKNDSLKLQIKSIEYIDRDECQCISIDHPDQLYITDDFIVTHNTYCTIKSSSLLNYVTLILTSGLINQWRNEYIKYTDIDPDDIYIIQGFESLELLVNQDKYFPKVIIASLGTMRPYALGDKEPYNQILPYEDFQHKFNIGIKCTDECHMNFHINNIIDLKSYIPINIYLSATYARSDVWGKKIFNQIYPPTYRFGEGVIKKYINIFQYEYNIGFLKNRKFSSINGYSQPMYEKFIINDKYLIEELINKILTPLIYSHFLTVKKEKQKCLILCHTVDMCNSLTFRLKNYYPNLIVNKYTYEDNDDQLEDGVDIIVSTPKSAGTGRDIKNLKTLILLSSIASEPLIKQIVGRLRELDNDEPIFIDLWNNEIPAHCRHKNSKAEIFKIIGKSFYQYKL